MQKSDDKNMLIYLPLIRVFSLYHDTNNEDRVRSSFLQFVVGLLKGTLSNRRRRPDDGNRKRDNSFETSLRMYNTL